MWNMRSTAFSVRTRRSKRQNRALHSGGGHSSLASSAPVALPCQRACWRLAFLRCACGNLALCSHPSPALRVQRSRCTARSCRATRSHTRTSWSHATYTARSPRRRYTTGRSAAPKNSWSARSAGEGHLHLLPASCHVSVPEPAGAGRWWSQVHPVHASHRPIILAA